MPTVSRLGCHGNQHPAPPSSSMQSTLQLLRLRMLHGRRAFAFKIDAAGLSIFNIKEQSSQ
jgi:hypothetical protein